jgi:plastocyanin
MAHYLACSECGVRLKSENEESHMRKVHPKVMYSPRDHPGSRRPRQSFHVTSRARKALFAIAIAAAFIAAGVMLLRDVGQTTPLDASARAVHVSMSGFNPSTITVKAGTLLRIDLINMDNEYHTDGGGWHNFAMDDFGMNVSVEPSGQKLFTVPTNTPGSYGWYCSVCCGGRESPSMNGRLIVEA